MKASVVAIGRRRPAQASPSVAPERRAPGPARGVLPSDRPDGVIEHHRALPAVDLAPVVAHFWWVQWSLNAPFRVETLPHPAVHIIFEGGSSGHQSTVQGVPTRRFVRQLRGQGFVFGIKFRPAVFPSWLASIRALSGPPRPRRLRNAPLSMSRLTDRHLALGRLFGPEGRAFAETVLTAVSMEARTSGAEAFLRGSCVLASASAPASAPLGLPKEVVELRDLVERMATDRSLLRAENAARLLGVDLRTLQRRFQKHVGVGPKWVLQRYRLHEAAERLKGPHPPAVAELAASLGYFDQAHFAREFKAMVGRTPKAFLAQVDRAREPRG